MTAMPKLALTVVLAALVVAIVVFAHDADQRAKEVVSFLKNASHSLRIDPTGAHFVTRHFGPKFKMGDWRLPETKEWQFEFTLSKPGERFFSPDKHGGREFVVKRVTADSIVLGYKESSMGQVVMSSSGEITLRPFDNGTSFETEDADIKNAH
jgi:hypothetical protein